MKTPDQIWQRSGKDLLDTLESGPGGLTSHEAARRLERYGPNELREGGKKSTFRIFLEQFADFLVIILILAAVVSAVLGDVESTVVILAVITMNAVLGTVQTVKAEASLDSLKQMSAPTAKVLRDGTVVQIPGREVVPGDIVVLEAGDAVCADGRLLECASLKTAESALTGESLPVEKAAEVIDGEVPLGDRKNMVFSGTFVTYGRGRFLVTGTGMDTEMGKIAALLKSTSEKKTPLQVSLDQFGKKLSIGILILCGLLFAVSVLLRGENVMSAFLFAVALAVAAIPEALSSFGTRKMAKEHAVIRKLQAVEGLGSVSVICSDKTGTLTQNKMTVRQLYVGGRIIPAQEANFKDPVQEPLLRAALLCSDATVNEKGEIGDPTETALVRLGEDFGFDELDVRDQWPRLGELPFDSDRKLMSTVHRFAGGYMLVTKGAVIESMTDQELQDFVPQVSVYARVSPEHKIRIVRAWQERGALVAMTGDGVNDAPALKQADIGVAMGITGTEVAKDAAGMVLTDDNFATIVQAVKNGRNVYANIRRSIQFLLSGNMAGILTVLYASLLALPVPFAAVHLLFINLLTDSLPAIALGLEPHTEQVMHEKPRPRKEGILTKPFLASVGLEGLVIAVGTIVAFHLGLRYGGEAAGATMAFATLCLSRLFHGFNCKAAEPVLFTRRFWNNKPLLGAFLVGALLLSAVLVIPPLEELMQAVALPWQLGLAIPALAVGSMVVIQLLKAIRVRLRKAS